MRNTLTTVCLLICLTSVNAATASLIIPELPGADTEPSPMTNIATSAAYDISRQATTLKEERRRISLDEVKNVSVPIKLGVNTNATVSAQKMTWQHQAENLYSHLSVGTLEQASQGLRMATALNAAYTLTEKSTLGGNLFFSPQRSEIVVNSIYQWPLGLRIKGSLGYMWGKQDFDFPSGKAGANLSQYAYAVEVKYHDKDWFKNIQALGVSAWGSAASQRSGDDPVYTLQQTATSYNVLFDSRKLAVGRLSGQALDVQVALLPNLVLQSALGREQLVFPFSDGTQERRFKPFVDLKLHYEPISDWQLMAQYQNGTSAQQLGFSMQYLSWKISLQQQQGRDGVQGSHSVMLSYDLISGRRSAAQSSLAERMQPNQQANTQYALLRDAATRPSVMPQNFLAKIDPSASKKAMTICKNTSLQGAALSPDGKFTILVGSGAITITQAQHNGSVFAYDGIFRGGNGDFIIELPKLPKAISTDMYVIDVVDGNGTRYRIEADASLLKSSC